MQHGRHEGIGYALIGVPTRIGFDADISGNGNVTSQLSLLRSKTSCGNQLSDHTFGCRAHKSTGYLRTGNLREDKVRGSYSIPSTAGQAAEAVPYDTRRDAHIGGSLYKANAPREEEIDCPVFQIALTRAVEQIHTKGLGLGYLGI